MSTSKGFKSGLKKLFRSKPTVKAESDVPAIKVKEEPQVPTVEPISIEEIGYIRLQADSDEFRLFKIEGKGFTASYGYEQPPQCPLDGQLEIYSLSNCPPYIALSYEWGNPTQARTLETASRPLNLQDNLVALLSALAGVYFDRSHLDRFKRKPPPVMHLWVDQICINQRSKSERSSQVKMMGDIFRNAESVIAWPGYVLEYHRPSHSGANKMLEVEKFLQARYWRRLWIVQEAMLAKEILTIFMIVSTDNQTSSTPFRSSGAELQPWSKVMDSLTEYTKSEQLLQQTDRHFKGIVAHRAADTRSQLLPLMDAISQFSDSGCLDPRDKVYGLLGIVQPEQRIEVNYRFSAQQVFEATAGVIRAIEPTGDAQNHKQAVVLSLLARDMNVQLIESIGNNATGGATGVAPEDKDGPGRASQLNDTSRRRNSFG